jgi:hypothetical protein
MIEAVRVYQLRALRDSLSLRQIELVRLAPSTKMQRPLATGDRRMEIEHGDERIHIA